MTTLLRPVRVLLLLSSLLVMGCGSSLIVNSENHTEEHPEIQREFRAAWVATVANINWPSEPGLSVQEMKKEAIHLLDILKSTNFNAVIFQVRPQADALYKSELEPWSYYLTGEQGKAPDDDFDPLEFWIEEAHKRGLELHAWLNPYRAHHPSGGPVSGQSVVYTKSELVLELQNGYWWFDPSLKETQQHSLNVVMDIVSRYDVDGIHFDDYFYPYPDYNSGQDFPDQESWENYLSTGGSLLRNDWRRASVNNFISSVYSSIKEEKPHVKFGLSPFGIWRPEHPKSIKGFDQYDVLFADAKKWLNEGWIDYFSPQLYWPVNQIPQSFPVLLGWWNSQNTKNRFIWPGMSIGRLSGGKQLDEVINQIMITRGMNMEAPGTVHWSIAPLVDKDSLRNALKAGPYSDPALIPELTWTRQSKVIETPEFTIQKSMDGKFFLKPKIIDQEVSKWIVYARYDDRWITKFYGANTNSIPVYYSVRNSESKIVTPINRLEVTSVDRLGNESKSFVISFSDD